MNVPGHNQNGRGKEIVYRTFVNPWHVLFGGQNNLQCSQIIDVASSTSRGLRSVPGAHTDSSVAAAWEKAAWAIWSVREAAGKLLLARPPHSWKYHSAKLSLGKVSVLYSLFFIYSLFFPRVGSPALVSSSWQVSASPNPFAFSWTWYNPLCLQQREKPLMWLSAWVSFCSARSREGAGGGQSRGGHGVASSLFQACSSQPPRFPHDCHR